VWTCFKDFYLKRETKGTLLAQSCQGNCFPGIVFLIFNHQVTPRLLKLWFKLTQVEYLISDRPEHHPQMMLVLQVCRIQALRRLPLRFQKKV
jgi:hypothetical protein